MVRLLTARPLTGYRLQVRFNDGLEGVFPVEPERRGGLFLKLLDERVCKAVAVNADFGCVEWPGGVDLCPDTMHQAMTAAAAEPPRQWLCAKTPHLEPAMEISPTVNGRKPEKIQGK
jgi:hypothetical protein